MGMITAMKLSPSEVDSRIKEVVNSPLQHMKASKNKSEIEGIRRASLKDSAAIIEYFAWLEAALNGIEYQYMHPRHPHHRRHRRHPPTHPPIHSYAVRS